MTMELNLTACGEGAAQPNSEIPEPPAQVQETPEPVPVSSSELEVTEGTETYRGFQMDNVLHTPEGDIHYHIYVPDGYDGSEAYALFLTLPGYEGLYFQGVGENLYREDFAFEALNYKENMIVAAPQLNDWGETSARQTIALTEYLLGHYNIDQKQVYAEGYSGGGETMSQVMGMRPDLFTAYLQCSSQWDGDFEPVVEARVPVYFVVGQGVNITALNPPERHIIPCMRCINRQVCHRRRSISFWFWTSKIRIISAIEVRPISTEVEIYLRKIQRSWAGCLNNNVTM